MTDERTTDDKAREAQIRQHVAVNLNWHLQEEFLLRLLDDVRADYAALKAECQDEETMTELRAEIARLRAPPEADLMQRAYRAIWPWVGLNDGVAPHDCATAVAKAIAEARAAAFEEAARLCNVAATHARHIQGQQLLRTPSQSGDIYIERLAEHIFAATKLGRAIRGLAEAAPQSEGASE